MDFMTILPLLAGIGIYLFGIDQMRSALERLVAPGLESLLEMRSNSKIGGLVLGAGVAAAVQSSSTASIMVLGLLSASVFSLGTAIPVILGANFGSTLTLHLLRIGDLGVTDGKLELLTPEALGAIMIIVGVLLYLYVEHYIINDAGGTLLGLGLMFFGMGTMEKAFAELQETSLLQQTVNVLSSPIIGLLLGLIVAALLRSATASLGILLAMSATGLLSFHVMLPIVMGANIGRCSSVVIANIGARRDAGSRAVLADILSNILGILLCALGFGIYQLTVGVPFWNEIVSYGDIANFHTLFNLFVGIIALPLINPLVSLFEKLHKEEKLSPEEAFLEGLNEQLLVTPSIALEQAEKALASMSDMAVKNLNLAISLFHFYNPALINTITAQEDLVDRYDDKINNYLSDITALDITERDMDRANNMMQDSVDWERIADHAMNIMEVATFNYKNNVNFSNEAKRELNLLCDAISEVLDITQKSQSTNELELAYNIEPLEEVINELQVQMKDSHLKRLVNGHCNVQTGISFVEVLSNLERISDHCSNIALHMIQEESDEDVDIHDYANDMHEHKTQAYRKAYEIYSKRYSLTALDNDEM